MSEAKASSQMNISAVLDGRDEIQFNDQVHASGCHKLLQQIKQLCKQYGSEPKNWPQPSTNDHCDILIRELILKHQGQWHFPYEHDELCHCRSVSAHIVDQAIIAGAHTPTQVTRQTSAGSSCGTCQPDIEKLIQFRLSSQIKK